MEIIKAILAMFLGVIILSLFIRISYPLLIIFLFFVLFSIVRAFFVTRRYREDREAYEKRQRYEQSQRQRSNQSFTQSNRRPQYDDNIIDAEYTEEEIEE